LSQVLLVEDDRMLGDAVAAALARDGWQVDRATDAASAQLALVDHAYAAVLLDLGLPRGSGLDVLRTLRQRYDPTPVLVVTARDRLSDRVSGLDAGADDYLVKPFQSDELLARLRALVRRAQGRVTPQLSWRGVNLDPASRTVTRDGADVRLGASEYRTLLALLERRGRVVPRETLESLVYGGEGTIESNTIAVYVHQLRRKFGEDFITTVHGIGYRIG
jgi:Response regulators consisting of a CheY-like receiver domain and a winged-helix DNA-binding domain